MLVFVRRQKVANDSRDTTMLVLLLWQSWDSNAFFLRVPKQVEKWALRLELLSLREEDVQHSSLFWTFSDWDVSKWLSTTLGYRFASPFKKGRDQSMGVWERSKECWRNTAWHYVHLHQCNTWAASTSTPVAGTSTTAVGIPDASQS